MSKREKITDVKSGEEVISPLDTLVMLPPRVLIACEFSGIVREAFAAQGCDAWSCDLLPTEKPGQHFQCDVREVLTLGWDLMIAHDPCTYQCNSGVCWLIDNPERWQQLDESCELTKEILNAPIDKICRENPIPHKYAIERIGRKYDQIIQPYEFGHAERKATCLWLKGLPKLKPTKNVKEEMEQLPKKIAQRIHWTSPGENRGKIRSITFEGVAKAMAEQWTPLLMKRSK